MELDEKCLFIEITIFLNNSIENFDQAKFENMILYLKLTY